jgi:uncharacterized 2Fe-2S/4Fe-4S cluster protein (DUF4445 family)
MPIVTFFPSGKTLEVEVGTLLFDAAVLAGLPVASSCQAKSVCGRCDMQVLEGKENLSEQDPKELSLLRRNQKLATNRISCLTRVFGNCTVTTGYW